jgi:hypothetical protein
MDTLQAISEALGYEHVSLLIQEPAASPELRDEDLKFALFGDINTSDEAMDDVRRYALFIQSRNQKK